MDPQVAAQAAVKQIETLVADALLFGAGGEWRTLRERAEAVTAPDLRERLTRADAEVLHMVQEGEPLWPGLFADQADQPLAHWWWHLGALRKGSYPQEQLPDALRQHLAAA